MKPARPERDHKNRWCFRCETWRDMEPWSDSWGGCRCPTCEYVAKVANPFFEALQCSVCGRPCEGVSDEKGRIGCSYECAYKIGHITREIMVQYAGRKWQAARSNRDAPVIGATEPTPTTYTIGETEVAHRIATLEQELRDARAAFDSCNRARRHCEDECASLRARACITNDAGEASLINTLEHMLGEERENVDTLRAAVEHAEQRFVDEYDARRDVERQRDELQARITTLEAMKP